MIKLEYLKNISIGAQSFILLWRPSLSRYKQRFCTYQEWNLVIIIRIEIIFVTLFRSWQRYAMKELNDWALHSHIAFNLIDRIQNSLLLGITKAIKLKKREWSPNISSWAHVKICQILSILPHWLGRFESSRICLALPHTQCTCHKLGKGA